jgi:hypothetical protein
MERENWKQRRFWKNGGVVSRECDQEKIIALDFFLYTSYWAGLKKIHPKKN